MQIVINVIGALLALAFLIVGGAKIATVPAMRESASHLGLSVNVYRGIGVLELAGALGLLIGLSNKSLGIAAAIGLFLLLIGAIGSHVRARDSVAKLVPALVLGALAAVYIGMRLAT